MSDVVYVITAAYSDKSGFKVLCSFSQKHNAEWLVEFLRPLEGAMSQIEMHEVPTFARFFREADKS